MHTDTREIVLTQGQVALVDAADYEWLNQWKWHASVRKKLIYAARKTSRKEGDRKCVYMHRVVIHAANSTMVDHVNHNTLDNRRANLRPCTKSENQRNRLAKKGCSSKYLGVFWLVRVGKWQAKINANGEQLDLGRYVCEIEAARAYDAAARQYHGAFANPNFEDAARDN